MLKLAVKAITRLLKSAAIVRLDVMANALGDPDATIEPFVSANQRARMPSSARPELFTFENGRFSAIAPCYWRRQPRNLEFRPSRYSPYRWPVGVAVICTPSALRHSAPAEICCLIRIN